MWNKKLFSLVLVLLLTGTLSAQYYNSNTKKQRQRSGTVKVQQSAKPQKTSEKSEKKSNASAQEKFNPQKPDLTQSQIDSVMNGQIRKKLLELKIPTKLPGSKEEDDDDTPKDEEKQEKGSLISRLDFAIVMSHYASLIANFELSEVSGIRPEWYQQYQTELRKFGPIINDMTISIRFRSKERYGVCVKKFKEHQEACLKFLKEKPPRISREQYQALVVRNSKIRLQNYQKRLQAEREAAIKRRQEMLKQQQQKNQPKKQVNQTPAGK